MPRRAGSSAPDNLRENGEQKDRDIVVFWARRDATCSECGDDLGRGALVRVEGGQPVCLVCADLDHLEYLPRGDAALTRRAIKHSTLHAVVVEWSRTRKRYERQGCLVEAEALRQAEEDCLQDAELRARRRMREAIARTAEDEAYIRQFSAAVVTAFPGCPAQEAQRIAEHACARGSGRIGRSAAAKELDADALRLAVVAHVRHTHTDYDRLLSQIVDRMVARELVRDRVDAVLDAWASGALTQRAPRTRRTDSARRLARER